MGLKTLSLILCLIITVNLNSLLTEGAANQAEGKAPDPGRVDNFLSILKHASVQGASYTRDLVSTIPFTKIILTGGALLSLFFMFLRLLIVLGPILILGSMTRESTDAGDFIRILIEFYNQIVTAMDENKQNDHFNPNK